MSDSAETAAVRRPPGRPRSERSHQAIVVATLEHINAARDRVMAGITRYAHKQEALDGRIETARHEFAALNAAEPKDFDRIDALAVKVDAS